MTEESKRKPGRPKEKVLLVENPNGWNGLNLTLGKRVLREINRLSGETKITKQQVLDDICDNGLIAVKSMYVGLIETRKALQEELNEKDTHRRSPEISETSSDPEPTPDGEVSGEPLGEYVDNGIGTETTPEQFDTALIERGFEETASPDLREDFVDATPTTEEEENE